MRLVTTRKSLVGGFIPIKKNRPTMSDVHVDAPLTNVSIGFMQQAEGWGHKTMSPRVPSPKQSNKYFRYDRADMWRNTFKTRAVLTPPALGNYKVDPVTFECIEYALAKDIPDQVRDNEDAPLSHERDAATYLGEQAMIAREIDYAAAQLVTGVWTGIDGTTGDVTGVSGTPTGNQFKQWNDAASTPLVDVKLQRKNIQKRIGRKPNKMAMGQEVWNELEEHADIIDRIKYTSGNDRPAVVTQQAVAALMGLDEIVVLEGIKTTSEEVDGFETGFTADFISGKVCLLAYVAPSPSIWTPSASYTFVWEQQDKYGENGIAVKRYRLQEELKADRVEGEMNYVQKVVCPDCGVFFDSAVA